MAFRKVDKNNDWVYGNGRADYAEGQEEVALDLKTALLEWTNNCWFSLSSGVDYATYLSTPNTQDALEQNILQVGVGRPGVDSVQFLSTIKDVVNNLFQFTLIYKTIYNVIEKLSLDSNGNPIS